MTASYESAIGLGANLGDPLAALRAAVAGLRRLGRVTGVSALYRTAAVGPPQPDFLNASVGLRSRLSPQALLCAMLELEQQLGRVRQERWGPRCIDLDLLWIEGFSCNSESLCVPHPRLEQRRFALEPLLDVYPKACHPITGRPYASRLRALSAQVATRIADARWLESPTQLG